jgi:hypothetical protein
MTDGVRDGFKAVEGIAKAANTCPVSAFAGLDQLTPKTTQFTAPKNGEVIRLAIYDDGIGSGLTGINVKIWDKDPDASVVQDRGVAGINDIFNVDITGLPIAPGTAQYLYDRVISVVYRNNDTKQTTKLYVKLTGTGAAVAQYSGNIRMAVKEADSYP